MGSGQRGRTIVDIRQLKVLIAVVDHGGLAKASAMLRLSQPSLTKIVKRLEAELSVKLFVREARGMIPTEFTKALIPYARAAVANLNQANAEALALLKGSKGRVSVISSAAIGRQILPQAVKNLSRTHPNLRIHISLEPSESLTGAIDGQSFDFGLGALEGPLAVNVSHKLLFYDSMVIACRRDHPLTALENVTPEDLAGSRWVAADERSITRRRFEHLFQSWGVRVAEPAIECRSTAIAKEIIADTDLICMLAAITVHDELARGVLSTINVEGANLERAVGLFWCRGRMHTPGAKALIDEITNICKAKTYGTFPRIKREHVR